MKNVITISCLLGLIFSCSETKKSDKSNKKALEEATGLSKMTITDETSSSGSGVLKYIAVNTWIDDFKNFRMAIYNNDLPRLKSYFVFPFDDEGKTILHVCELTEKDWLLRKKKFKNPELFYETDLEKYYKKVFDSRFTNAVLKIKSEALFSEHTCSTKTFIEKDIIYQMHADYNEADKTLILNMAFGNNDKYENGDYVSEGEHNIIYRFKIIDNKKLTLVRMDIAG
ncbi:hypothetical protein [Pedobacter jamesrossensis]|uniref:Uncharacterized protein n=1 Tax=Pedobacter jamesrossensis TaxID=1908238 RepID=A0ABV8NJR6_9SPHI